jgi:F5/8 type C domain/Right handed beta helix region
MNWKLSTALSFSLLACTSTTKIDPANTEPAPMLTVYAAPNGSGSSCVETQPCSLTGAKDFVRTKNLSMTGNIVVQLEGGTYFLTSTLKLEGADSGSNGHSIIYRAKPGARVQISGGQVLQNWSESGGLLRTNVGALRFRALYSGDQPAVRSNEPDVGYGRLNIWNKTSQAIEIKPGDWPNPSDLSGVEMLVQRHWNQHRLRLETAQLLNDSTLFNASAGRFTIPAEGSKAADGDESTFWASNPADAQPFWWVDLGRAVPIKRIEIVTRKDGDFVATRRNFKVQASNNGDMSLGHTVLGEQGSTALPVGGTWAKDITDTTAYRYVAIVKTVAEAAAFAEVRVLSQSKGDYISLTAKNPERGESFAMPYPAAEPEQSFKFENSASFVDEPGEFYLNNQTGDLIYKARAGETAQNVNVIAPKLEALVQLEGTAGSPAHHIAFEGIEFAHSDWLKPTDEGFAGIQGPWSARGVMPAGVRVKQANNIRFERSTFRLMGASALDVLADTSQIKIIGCRFSDIGGQGISLDPANDSRVSDIEVRSNRVTRIGQQYPGSVGIFLGYAANTKIVHNELYDLPYSAISVGWGWSATETRGNSNLVKANHIYNVMNLLADGAAVYTLSNQAGTQIVENYIHDLKRSEFASDYSIAGVYLDEGSSNITVKNNVLENLPKTINQNRVGTGNVFENNESRIQGVIDNAGPEAAYR